MMCIHPIRLRILCAVASCSVFAVLPARCESPLSSGEHTVVVNGVRLWYKVGGVAHKDQAPLVFLHGGPGYNSYSFEKTVGSKLEDHMQVIYLDQRGSGHSERPWTMEYGMSALVEDVEALREALGVARLSLLGHSIGGTVALEYAAKYPMHVEKLIILDGAADIPAAFHLWRTEIEQRYPSAWQNTLKGDKGRSLELAAKTGDACTISKAEFAAEMETLGNVDGQAFHQWQQFHDQRYRKEQDALDAASGLRNTGEIGGTYFAPDSDFLCYKFAAYDQLTMPVLVMVGTYDGAVGTAQMRFLADHLPHGQYNEFEQSAHFPYAEQQDKFVQDLSHFLRN